ncbi:hypothetical protein Hamer_G016765 [Homarus americanus]|uniref:Uncharacterized protein n=1 Tax=Homarus americanus TaxID=6706 RepID=A0A8J5K0Y8_HOMAM|nr:hypothetical protein Hamer_G016765 [Homarus americanus]
MQASLDTGHAEPPERAHRPYSGNNNSSNHRNLDSETGRNLSQKTAKRKPITLRQVFCDGLLLAYAVNSDYLEFFSSYEFKSH